MATATTTKVETPKKTLAQPPSSDPVHTSPPEDVNPATTTNPSSNPSETSPPVAPEKITGDADDGALVTDTQKKIRRAERFGMPVQLSEKEKRDSRAERFGTGPGLDAPEALKKSDEQKRKARAERFGIAQSTSSDEDAKKKARLARFAPASKPDAQEEDKRKARAIRFSQSASLTKENGKENTDLEAAVESKAGGGT